MAGAPNVLYYENLDKTTAGSISCENTYPNFAEQTIQGEFKNGVDRLKFYNDETVSYTHLLPRPTYLRQGSPAGRTAHKSAGRC